jgi:hypothetical protein
MIAGGAIQGIGDLTGSQGLEAAGKDIVLQQIADLNKTAPFQREFSEIDSGSKAWDWAMASLGQAGPSLLESVAVMVGGAALGLAAGPGGSAGGAVLSLGAKEAIKDQIKAAALKKAQVGWAGLEAGEKAILKRAAVATYGTAAALSSNYAAGFGESYLATEEAGVANPYAALLAAAPYAALETLPEFLLFSRYMGNKLPATTTGTSKLKSAGQRGLLGLKEGALGGVAEGLTEAGQELVTGALAPTLAGGQVAPDLASRVLEAGAAGTVTGAAVGGMSGLLRGRAKPIGTDKPVNLLEQKAEPTPGTLVGEPTQVGGMGARPDFVAGAEGVRVSTPGDRIYTGEVQPNQFGGAQGVLDLGGIPVAEAKARSMQTGELAPRLVWNPETLQYEQQTITTPPSDRLALPPPATPIDPRQMALQFAPPAPSGIGFTERVAPPVNPIMEQQMNLAQSRQALAQAQQQAAAQRQADLERLGNVAAAQRQLDFAAQAPAPTPAPAPMPMVAAQPRAPRQISMFDRGQPLAGTPRPSRAEGIRRGIGVPIPPALTLEQVTVPGLPVQTQLPLFTQRGQPSVAALKAAGQRGRVTPTVEQGAKVAPPTGAPVTAVTAAAAKAKVLKKGKEDAVQKPSPVKVPVRKGAEGGKRVGQEVRRAKEPAQKGKALKGKAKAEVAPAPKKEAKLKKGKAAAAAAPAVPANQVPKDYFEQVLAKYNTLTPEQRDKVATRLETTRDKMPDLLDTRTEDADEAISRVLREEKIAEAARKVAATKEAERQAAAAPAPKAPAKDQTSRELLDDMMRGVEETKADSTKLITLIGVMEFAYTPDSNDRKAGLDKVAQDFLNSIEKDAVFKRALVNFMRTQSGAETEVSATDKKGNETPLFQMIIATDQLEKAKSILGLKNLPAQYQNTAVGNTPVTQDKDKVKDNSAIKLLDYIKDINTRTGFAQNDDTQAKILIKLTEMWAQVRKDGLQGFITYANKPLSEYFNADGTPKTVEVNKKLRVVSSEISEDTLRDMEAMDADRDLDTDVDPDLVAAEQE